jgi:hypothetical protein
VSRGDPVNSNLTGDGRHDPELQRVAMHYLTAAGLLPFQHLHKKWVIWREVGGRDQPGMTTSYGPRVVFECRCGWRGVRSNADRYVWGGVVTEAEIIRRHIEELAIHDPHSALWAECDRLRRLEAASAL